MPRYRVGTRVFDSAADAEAFRLAHPEAPSVFVEPDSAPAVAARRAPWLSRPEAPVIITGAFAAVDLLLLLAIPHREAFPMLRLGPAFVLYGVYVWRVWTNVSVLCAPAGHKPSRVTWATFVLGGRVVFLALLVIAVVYVRAHDAMLRGNIDMPPPEPIPIVSAGVGAGLAVDAGAPAPARTWSAYSSPAGRFTTSFPGRPVESAGAVELHTADGATFTVRYSPLRGRTTSNATRSRLVAERDTLLERTGGVLLDDRDVPRRDGLERIVRVGVATPATVVWARLVAVGGTLYVAGVSLPASQPDGDARTFLDSLTIDPPAR